MLCFGLFMQHETDIGRLCVGIVIGIVAGEISSFIYLSLFYVFGIRPKRAEKQSLKPFARVAMPIAASSYVTSILHTVENVLIPYCLALFGNDRAESLAQFGLIRGMVIPIVFFPFAFLSSLVSILIPEISRLNTRVDKTARDARIERVLFLAFVFSTAVGGVFFFFPEEIAVLLYKDAAAAPFLRLIALVTPFMYVETIADGLLKSIGEQVYTLKTSIINSVCRIVIIYLLVPRAGAMGYTYLLIASNTFAFLTWYDPASARKAPCASSRCRAWCCRWRSRWRWRCSAGGCWDCSASCRPARRWWRSSAYSSWLTSASAAYC